MARLCGVSWRTISEYYDDDYELGVVQFNMPVAANLWRIATSETDPQAANAAMKWLERRGGENWKPPRFEVKTEHVQEKPLIDSSRLTFEDRAALRQMLTRLDEEGAVPASEGEANDDVTARARIEMDHVISRLSMRLFARSSDRQRAPLDRGGELCSPRRRRGCTTRRCVRRGSRSEIAMSDNSKVTKCAI